MTPTELMLFAAHRSPVIPLADICKDYLGLEPETASQYASLHRLPISAFRLNASRKAPWVVDLRVLAAHIDSSRQSAAEQFLNSN